MTNFNTSHCKATSKTCDDGGMDVEPVTWTGVLLSVACHPSRDASTHLIATILARQVVGGSWFGNLDGRA